ncbi:MAG TPA: ABC transporter permease, partial [Rhodothermales bacterium]
MLLEIWESFWIALRAIQVNKLRAVLTTLGIVIGITAVTSMVTVVNGIEREFEQSLSDLGADVLYVERWPWVTGPRTEWWVYRNRPRITDELVEVIESRSRYARAVAPVVYTGRSAVYGGRTVHGVGIEGSTEDYERVHNVRLAQGRFYNALDNRTARKVAV